MSLFRYETNGAWFKGNCHLHSTASDGGKTQAEITQLYTGAGYDFLFLTDHWVASDVQGEVEEQPLLWMDGIELHGKDPTGAFYHVVCLGTFKGISREMGFVAALEAARAQDGFLILAHPHWTGNSMEDSLRWRFDAVEIYNHVCRWLNGKGDSAVFWNTMLRRFPNTLAFAVDDAHLRPEHPGWNGGWIMVNAANRSREAIQYGIRAGNFYSTCGPEFHSIQCHGTSVTIETSPVQFVRLVGPAYLGDRIGSFDGKLISEATMEIRPDWAYAYLEVEDNQGRRAWTNNLFTKKA
jgi:hypothetical protein